MHWLSTYYLPGTEKEIWQIFMMSLTLYFKEGIVISMMSQIMAQGSQANFPQSSSQPTQREDLNHTPQNVMESPE